MHPKPPLVTRVLGARSLLLSSLQGYRSAWLLGHVAAGLTLLSIAVPEQLATARLAGMPPITGFYAFVAGTIMFALLGSNPQMSVGADSTIAPLFAVGIATAVSTVPGDYMALVGILAVMVGVIVALVGLLRLGWIAEFLSAPIITGFLGGVAVIIVVHQLPDLLGLSSGSGGTLYRLGQGAVAHGAPHLGLHGPSWSTLGAMAPIAGMVALVIVSQSAATTRAFADKGGYDVDVNRDFVGIGAGNMVTGLVGAFPVNASPPRTAAVVSASGRTQMAGIAAAGALIVLIPALALLENLPVATLAAILIFIATRIVHVRDLIDIARYDRFEFGLALVTLLTVAFIGVEHGIGVAVALAILDRTRLSARPHLHVLGRIPSTTSWAPRRGTECAVEIPGVLVALFATPLWYANAEDFRHEMTSAVDGAGASLQLVVLDAMGMTDIDYTGARALRQLIDQLRSKEIAFAMARTSHTVRGSLARSGLLTLIGEEHLFASVGKAVSALHSRSEDESTPVPPQVNSPENAEITRGEI